MRQNILIPIIFLAIYAIGVAANGVFYVWWSGDTSEVIKGAVRVGGVSLLCWGLYKSIRFFWWFSVVFTAFLSLAGFFSTYLFLSTGVLELRPHPNVDIAFFLIATFSLFMAFLTLLPEGIRSRFKKQAPGVEQTGSDNVNKGE